VKSSRSRRQGAKIPAVEQGLGLEGVTATAGTFLCHLGGGDFRNLGKADFGDVYFLQVLRCT